MRIAIGAFMLAQNPSGLGVYSRQVLQELTTVLAPSDHLTIFCPPCHQLACGESDRVSIRALPAIMSPRWGTAAAVARFVYSQTWVPSLLKHQDLFYSPTHQGLLGGRCTQVLTIHDLLSLRFPEQYRLQSAYFRVVLPRLIARSASIIVDSSSTRDDVCEQYRISPDQVHVVYAAVARTFCPASSAAIADVKARHTLGQYVLLVGASYPHKNMERAIEAFCSIRDRFPETSLVVAGGRPAYVQRLRAHATAVGLEAVRFIEYVPGADLPALYSGARLLLYPSLYEGFGLPPLEAMACGCPVVASRVSSIPEVCGDAAYYIEPLRVESIAEGIQRVMEDESLCLALRLAGLQRVKAFSWEETARGVYRVLSALA